MSLERALTLIEELRNEVSALVSQPPTPTPAPVDTDAPFGRGLNGTPRFAPAYDACRPMWEAAQREGWPGANGHAFTIFDYVPGLQMLGDPNPRRAPFQDDLRKLQDDIVALGYSARGQEWLANDVAAAMVARPYALQFLGYYVTRKSSNPDDGFEHRDSHGVVVPKP